MRGVFPTVGIFNHGTELAILGAVTGKFKWTAPGGIDPDFWVFDLMNPNSEYTHAQFYAFENFVIYPVALGCFLSYQNTKHAAPIQSIVNEPYYHCVAIFFCFFF